MINNTNEKKTRSSLLSSLPQINKRKLWTIGLENQSIIIDSSSLSLNQLKKGKSLSKKDKIIISKEVVYKKKINNSSSLPFFISSGSAFSSVNSDLDKSKPKNQIVSLVVTPSNSFESDYSNNSSSSSFLPISSNLKSKTESNDILFKSKENVSNKSSFMIINYLGSPPTPIEKYQLNFKPLEFMKLAEPVYYTQNIKLPVPASTSAIVLDWVMQVCHERHFKRETYHLTVNLIQRGLYNGILSIKEKELTLFQLLAVTCLFIAAKYEEIDTPSVKDFVLSTDNSYTTQQMIKTEQLILTNLQWRLTAPTPLHYLGELWRTIVQNMYKEQSNLPRSKNMVNILIQELTFYEAVLYLDIMSFIHFPMNISPFLLAALALNAVLYRKKESNFLDDNDYNYFIEELIKNSNFTKEELEHGRIKHMRPHEKFITETVIQSSTVEFLNQTHFAPLLQYINSSCLKENK